MNKFQVWYIQYTKVEFAGFIMKKCLTISWLTMPEATSRRQKLKVTKMADSGSVDWTLANQRSSLSAILVTRLAFANIRG